MHFIYIRMSERLLRQLKPINNHSNDQVHLEFATGSTCRQTYYLHFGGEKKKINYRELDWVRIVCRELLERMLREVR